MAITASTKYYVIAVVGILIAVFTYVQGHPQLTETDIIAIVLIVLYAVLHDLEPPVPAGSSTISGNTIAKQG
jgi:hypothetical protein